VALTKSCQKALNDAEQKIAKLTADDNYTTQESFDAH